MKYLFYILLFFSYNLFPTTHDYFFTLKITPPLKSPVYLGYHYFGEQFITDTLHLDSNGCVSKKLLSYNEGMYFVIIDEKKYFNFILNNNTNVSISIDTSDILNSFVFENDKENYLFNEYQKILKSIKKYLQYNSQSKDSANKTLLKEQLQKLEKQIFNEIEDTKLLYKLIKAVNINKEFTYNARKFFQDIDFTDEKMLYSAYYPKVLTDYFSGISYVDYRNIDSLYQAVDYVLFSAMINPIIYKEIFKYLFKNFDVTGDFPCHELFYHLSEFYVLKGLTPWYKENFKNRLKNYIQNLSKVLVNNKFKSITLNDTSDKEFKIPDETPKYKFIIFWQPDCPHCKQFMKELNNHLDKNIIFYTVAIVKNKDEWVKSLKEYKIENLTNLYDKRFINDFVEELFLYETPQTFLLDKNNKIIAKNIKLIDLKAYIK